MSIVDCGSDGGGKAGSDADSDLDLDLDSDLDLDIDTDSDMDTDVDADTDTDTYEWTCKPYKLMQSGVLDLDLKAISVSGEVTLSGKELPRQSYDRGSIVFKESQGGVGKSDTLGRSGAGRYSLVLSPGEYDVYWEPGAGACYQDDNELPCNQVLLKQGLKLSTSGVLDLDLKAISVSGEVTLSGKELPGRNLSRGRIMFSGKDGSASTDSIGETGPASFFIVLSPGDYHVAWSPESSACTDDENELPCNAYEFTCVE